MPQTKPMEWLKLFLSINLIMFIMVVKMFPINSNMPKIKSNKMNYPMISLKW